MANNVWSGVIQISTQNFKCLSKPYLNNLNFWKSHETGSPMVYTCYLSLVEYKGFNKEIFQPVFMVGVIFNGIHGKI